MNKIPTTKKENQEGMRWVDRLNPVVLFEARQITRNRVTLSITVMLLAVSVATISTFILASQASGRVTFAEGKNIFRVITVILSVTTLLLVPIFTGIRLQTDRENLPLLFITPITPAEFLRGKIFSVAIFVMLNLSLCAPFMVFAVMLRGVDYLMIAQMIAGLFFATLFLGEVALLLASLPIEKRSKSSLSFLLLFLGFQFFGLFSMTGGIRSASFSGTTSPSLTFVLLLAIWASGTLILHQCTCALLTPKTANRALPFRLWVTGILATWGIIATGAFLVIGNDDFLLGFCPITLISVSLMLPAALCGPRTPSLRVRHEIPKTFWKRCLAFPCYSGAANGLVWLAGLTLVPLGIIAWLHFSSSSSSVSTRDLQQITSALLYFWGYGQAAILLHNLACMILKREIRRKLIALYFLLIAAVMNLLPYIATFLSEKTFVEDPDWGHGSIICVVHLPNAAGEHLTASALLFLIFFTINLPTWWLPQFKAFQPLPVEDKV